MKPTREDSPPSTTLPERVEHAFAARESSMYSYALMEGMVTQTLSPYLHLPGVNDVLAAGITPLTDPASSPFQVHTFRASKTNAAMFAHEETVYLYSLGTAAQVNTPEGDNAWMTVLCDFIRQFRPINLYVANFNRLVRSALFSGELMQAVEATGTVLYASGIRIDLSDPQGRVLWQTLAMLSDLERESIVQRLFSGTVTKFGRGEWILTEESVPAGYRLVGNKVELNPDQVEPVRRLIGLLADPLLSARQIVDEAGSFGLTSPTIQRHHGTGATFADVRRADSKVRSLLGYVPVWQTGSIEVRLPNPYRGVSRIGVLPVEDPDPPRHWGHVVLSYDVGVPEGGWADPAILAAAGRRVAARRETLNRTAEPRAANGGAAHRRRRPLSGWAGATDPEGRRLHLSGSSVHYLLMCSDPEDGHDPNH